MALFDKHALLEKHSMLLTVGILVVVAIGGIIEIAPLFYLSNTIERVNGMRPYTPLELAGREIYVREGCYVCHSQMIRPLRDEVERYGHYSLAAESMYDHPFQWGSKRTGPDLARVGGKYSDEWHMDHMRNPRSVVPESIMPPYTFMVDRPLDFSQVQQTMQAMRLVGVPYTDAMIENAEYDLLAQANPDFYPNSGDYDGALVDRYTEASGREGTVTVRAFDGDAENITEMDAMIAYLQMLGTLVDFETYEADSLQNRR